MPARGCRFVICGCRGSGWIDVDEEYVDRLAPLPDPSSPEYDKVRLKRVGLRNSVRPCPTHNGAVYARWVSSTAQERLPVGAPPPADLRRDLE